jgi:PAS domain S-box-containing protein
MKKFYNKKFVNILFAISVVTLLIFNIFVYLNLKSQFKTSETTQKFLELSGITTEFYSKVIEAETNRRGFLITNNTVFLSSYTDAINSIDSVYEILYSFLKTDSSYHGIIDSLAGLVKLRKDLWQESIVIQGKGGFKESRIQSEYMNKGRILMVKIKGLIDRILINARENIESGYSEEIKSSRATFTNLITGSSIALLLLIFSVYVLNKNITKRTISESNFQQSTRRLSTILESIGDGVIVTDSDGNVQFLNKAAALITGWTVEQAKGIPIEKVFDIINENTNLPQENPVRKVISTRNVVGLSNNTVLRTKAGELKPVDDSASPIIGDGYDFAGVVLVFRDISEKHKAQKIINENQKLIQKIADSLPGVIYLYIPHKSKITFVNYKVFQMLGYKPEEIIASGEKFLIEYIHPDDRRKFKNIYRLFSSLKNNQSLEHEYRIRNSQGEYRWFRSYEVVFSRDSNSRPREILGFAFDVTERRALEEQIAGYREHLEELVATRTNELDIINKQLKDEIKQRIRAEQEIRETEEKFRNLVENSPVGIYIVKDGKIAYVNNRFAGIFGYSPDELIGIDLVNLVIDDHKETARDHIRRGFLGEAGSMNISISCYKSDGTIIDINIYGTTIILNNEMAVIGTVIDVTEQNKLFRDIQKWNEKFNLIVESSGAIVYDYNVVTGDIIWGGSVTSILGYTQQEFSGGIFQWESLIHPDDREEAVALLAEAEKKGKAYEVEYRFKKKDGSYIWIYDKGFFVYDAGGKAIQMLGMMQDINVRKLYEQEIRRERNLFIGGPVVLFRWQNKEGWPVEYVSSNINQYGYTPEDFTEHKIKYADIIHPDDLERIAGEVKYYTENNYSNYEQYYRIKKSDGTYIHLYDFTVVV